MFLRAAMLAAAVAALVPGSVRAQGADDQAVLAVVKRMFDGMRAADSGMVRSTMAKSVRFAGVDARAVPPTIKVDSVDAWIRAIAGSNRLWDEQIYDVQVRVDDNMAQVWAPYTFYRDKKLSHCGVDSFELMRDATGWKITQLADTRRRENCRDVLK